MLKKGSDAISLPFFYRVDMEILFPSKARALVLILNYDLGAHSGKSIMIFIEFFEHQE